MNDVELASAAEGGHGDPSGSQMTPLLVVGGGKAYAISDTAPRKTIMSVIQKVGTAGSDQIK